MVSERPAGALKPWQVAWSTFGALQCSGGMRAPLQNWATTGDAAGAWFPEPFTPLVLVRIGCRVGAHDASGRLNIRGETMPGDSKENKRVPVVYRHGEFFE